MLGINYEDVCFNMKKEKHFNQPQITFTLFLTAKCTLTQKT